MEYTIQKLAHLSGVSTRTLRYYDEIGLLKLLRINSSGYRNYGSEQVNILQQVLLYRELDVSLEVIKRILQNPNYDLQKSLEQHHEKLLIQKERLLKLIANVNKTIQNIKGEAEMTDYEKFEGFKKKLVDDNEKMYGKEIREKYGNDAIDRSNEKVKNMTQQDYKRANELNDTLINTLLEAYKMGDPAGELAQQAADLHKEWLVFYWDKYSKEAHAGVAQLYVDDRRFTGYYDKYQEGLAEFLRDTIFIYTGISSKSYQF